MLIGLWEMSDDVLHCNKSHGTLRIMYVSKVIKFFCSVYNYDLVFNS